jgi:hypothetical protein
MAMPVFRRDSCRLDNRKLHLETKVLAFIDDYNRTMAKPFKWTYQGKALTI